MGLMLIVKDNYIIKVFKRLNLLEDFMADKKPERDKPHVQIGSKGHVGYGKTDLMKAISKALAQKGLDNDETIKPLIQKDVDNSIIDNAHEETDELKR